MKKTYVMIHVIKHDMDHNMDLNYRRKIRPLHARSHQHLRAQINIRMGVLYINCKLFKYFRGPPIAHCSLEV